MLLPPDAPHRPIGITRLCLAIGKEMKWGAWALVALYLSLVSGLIVGLQYDYLNPYYSSTAIDVLAPYGRFFRSLHFFSSQVFFFFCCVHLLAVYPHARNYGWLEWVRLAGSLPLILLLLFTGYILRGDNTGSSAGTIAENIIQAIPVIGSPLNDLLFSLSDGGLRKVYLHHVIGLDLLFLIFAWNHLRLYRINVRDHLPLLASFAIFSVFVSAPFEPDRLGINYISGPWFFLGLQELLRYLPPLAAGIEVPGLLLLIFLVAHPANRYFRGLAIGIGLFLACYGIVTCIAWNR